MMNPDSLRVEQAVLSVQQSFWTALKSKDAALFNRILADDFTAVSPREQPQSRTAFIRSLTAFTGEVIAVEGESIRVFAFGDIAVLTGVQTASVLLSNGMQVTDMLALNNVFRRSDGEWMLVLAHPVQMREEE